MSLYEELEYAFAHNGYASAPGLASIAEDVVAGYRPPRITGGIPTERLLRLLDNLVGSYVRLEADSDPEPAVGFIAGDHCLYGHNLDLEDKATILRIASGETWEGRSQ